MILIVDCGSQKTPFIEDSINELSDYQTIPLMELTLEDTQRFNGIIFSGAPLLVTEINMESYLSKYQWLKELSIPILGICFGHQFIGMLYDAHPSKMKEDRDWQEIEPLEDDQLFDKLPRPFNMLEDHCESISIPPGFTLLATSDACVNEAMRHKEKNIFGVQFHPEISGNTGMLIFENFYAICQRAESN